MAVKRMDASMEWRAREDEAEAEFLRRWEAEHQAMQARRSKARARRAANLPSGWHLVGDMAMPRTASAWRQWLRRRLPSVAMWTLTVLSVAVLAVVLLTR